MNADTAVLILLIMAGLFVLGTVAAVIGLLTYLATKAGDKS